jgi:hypothetical protein
MESIRPRDQWPSGMHRMLLGLAVAAWVSTAAGCGLPTWNELIGAQPANQAQPAIQPAPVQPVTPVRPPEPPPGPKPEEVIAEFRALKPFQITDEALNSLLSLNEGLEAVTELNLQGSQVGNRTLDRLSKLSHLAKLDARNSVIDKNAAVAIGQVPSLEELRVEGAKFDQAALAAIRPLSNLKLLDLSNAQLTPAGYSELLYHPKLQELVLFYANIDDESLNIVADLPDLERLWLSHTQVTDDGIARLAKLEKLVVLDLSNCPRMTGRTFAEISKKNGLKSLKLLSLMGTALNERGAASVRQMTSLEHLNLSYIPTMQDVHLNQMVRGMNELKELKLSHCSGLTNASMLAIKNHKTLELLDISYCSQINDRVFEHLITCKSLKQLHINNTNCTVGAIQKFKEFLPDCEVFSGL